MHYEENYDYTWVNFKTIGVLFIFLLIGIIIIAPISTKPIEKPIEPIVNQSYAIQIEYREVLVTPTPDGKLYFASEYEEGIRKLKRPFSFYRSNVQGFKDLSGHVTIYDYRMFDYYNWFNPSDYKYYREYPIDSRNNKFLFIFAEFYIDDDTRIWIPKDNSYGVQIQNLLYSPINITKQLRIKELEYTYNANDVIAITAYNSKRVYSPSTEYMDSAGEYSESIDILRGGKDNAIDGYLVFEIPKETMKEDITVLGNFHNFGSASWKLIT